MMADIGALLVQRGLARVTTRRRGRVGVFTVTKKSGRLRLILDCRRANYMCKAPPNVTLGSVAALGEMTVQPGDDLFVGQLDIKDCFYECGVPDGLGELFGLDASFSGAELIARGLVETAGEPIERERGIHLSACVCCPWVSAGAFGWCSPCTSSS